MTGDCDDTVYGYCVCGSVNDNLAIQFLVRVRTLKIDLFN